MLEFSEFSKLTMGFPDGSVGKESIKAGDSEDVGSIPVSGRSPLEEEMATQSSILA